MTLLKEIFSWSKDLAEWQSDAIARLLTKQTLTVEDLDDLFALVKEAHGIPDTKARKPKPLNADQIPTPINISKHVELHAIKNLKNVNAIAENQSLVFHPTGLTVIYGDNGSGKSGYSRVLKRACRSRDQTETILPNANLPASKISVAQASFEISINGGTGKDVFWINGKTAPPELSSFSIFDSRCARAYLDGEGDFSYVPYGLDIFEGLARVCQQLKDRIESESRQLVVDLSAFTPLQGDTMVGKLISSLTAKSKVAQIEALALLTSEEMARHAILEKSLKENNPKEKANQLRIRASRISTIAVNAARNGTLVDQEVVIKLRNMSNNLRSAKAVAELAAKQFKENDNLLPGTGGEAWRVLFEAARIFAIESHPDNQFPDLGAENPCPLCQQTLGDGAKRLIRFESFIQQEAEKKSQLCRTTLVAEYKLFIGHSLKLNLDEVTYGEIEVLDAQLALDVRAFEKDLESRQEAIKVAFASHNWDGLENKLINPTTRLTALADKLIIEATTLEKASDEQTKIVIQKEFSELNSRVKLREVKSAVIAAVSSLIHQDKLKQCLSAVKTNSISLKASELTEKVVSKELEQALNIEFKLLGVAALKVSLQSRTHKGQALHKLKLELPQSRNPSEILSEGEQRAIALGSFLAEVSLSGGRGGIVFDDPVSSLDHLRRERVAKRIATEAKQRQVIVFTHDIYFLCLLAEEASQARVPITTQSLVRRAEGFGIAEAELPFEGLKVIKRIGVLKNHHQTIAKLHKIGEEKEYRKQTVEAYYQLRLTWERAVEEVLFCNVVLRFRKGIETQRLAGVIVTDDDYAKVYAGMLRCSNYTHDKAHLGGIAVPEPDELLADIKILENWRNGVDSRNKKTEEQRKK